MVGLEQQVSLLDSLKTQLGNLKTTTMKNTANKSEGILSAQYQQMTMPIQSQTMHGMTMGMSANPTATGYNMPQQMPYQAQTTTGISVERTW